MDDIVTLHTAGQQLGPNSTHPNHGALNPPCNHNAVVYFIRPELSAILNVYGRMVAAGEWHDYAIDHLPNMAVFSIFRRASEMPLYSILKEPALAHKQGAWRITSTNGQILKRGKELPVMLQYFNRQLMRSV